MPTHRTLLTWLCCALMLCTGVSLRAGASCERDRVDASCCAPDQCGCSGEDASPSACDCDEDRPEPAPNAPAPRPEQVPAPQPLPWPRGARTEPEPRPACSETIGLPIGPLPRVSRQAALSVWRL